MSDTIYNSVFETADECQKYCTGIGSVCEETGESTDVETLAVD